MTAEPNGWDAYVGAVMRIEAPGGVVWVRPAPVTRTAGAYPDPAGRAMYVITAHNPGGRMASDTVNALAEARLAEELERRGLTWWSAAGGDPSWTHVEPSAAVIGVDEADAVALGAEFGQDAIFVLTPTDRRVIGCADRRVVATGWSIEPDDDLSASADDHEALEEPVTIPADEDEEADEPRGAIPAVEITVYTENLQIGEGEGSVAPKDYDDYINWAGHRGGLLCTLRRDEGAITLHGDGQGGVLISGGWNGLQGPFPVTAALQQLADVFESVVGFVSGTWGRRGCRHARSTVQLPQRIRGRRRRVVHRRRVGGSSVPARYRQTCACGIDVGTRRKQYAFPGQWRKRRRGLDAHRAEVRHLLHQRIRAGARGPRRGK